MMRLVTVASYLYPTDAHLARARLEAAGIPCLLANEYLAQIQWGLANALHGIQARVPEECAAAALKILQDDANHSLEAWVAFEREEAAQGEETAEREEAAQGEEASARAALTGPGKSGGMRRETPSAGRPDRAGDGIADFLAEAPEGVCPRCRSANVARREFGRVLRILIVFLLFFSPLPDRRRRFRCLDCGWRW